MKKLRATFLITAIISAFTFSAFAGDAPTTYTTTAPVVKQPSPLAGLFRPFGKVAKGTVDWAGAVTVGTAEEMGRSGKCAVNSTGKAVNGSGKAYKKGIGQYLTDTLDDNK